MNYRHLTQDDIVQIHHRKLRELELEHAALELELRLATVAGIDNEQVATAWVHRDILDVQHAALVAILEPHDNGAAPDKPESTEPAENH